MSSMQTLLQIFTDPGKAMEEVRERSMVFLPLALLVLGSVGLMGWYYQSVDIAWLQDYLLSADPNMEPAAREAAKGFMSAGVMTAMGVISVIIMIPLVLVLTAVYYLLAGKVIGNELGFGKWFAFSTWSAVPTLLLIPVGAVSILMSSTGQLAPEALNPLTLNGLLFQLPISNPWSGLLNAINLTSIWATVVAVIGYTRWTGKAIGQSAFIVLLPQLVIYGIWAAVAASKAA